jgi:hypothetical protein
MIASGRVTRSTRQLLFLEGEIQVKGHAVATAQGIFKAVGLPAA